jgi:hypothetical protein
MSTRAKEAESSTVRAESLGVPKPSETITIPSRSRAKSELQICSYAASQNENVGYKFGYRHQFGSITNN